MILFYTIQSLRQRIMFELFFVLERTIMFKSLRRVEDIWQPPSEKHHIRLQLRTICCFLQMREWKSTTYKFTQIQIEIQKTNEIQLELIRIVFLKITFWLMVVCLL